MTTFALYLKHPMNPGDGTFYANVGLQFCPRIGETIIYSSLEYTVEKVVHSETGITKLVISEL